METLLNEGFVKMLSQQKLYLLYSLLKPSDADDDMDRHLILYGMLMTVAMYKTNTVLATKLLEPLFRDAEYSKEDLNAIMQRINQL